MIQAINMAQPQAYRANLKKGQNKSNVSFGASSKKVIGTVSLLGCLGAFGDIGAKFYNALNGVDNAINTGVFGPLTDAGLFILLGFIAKLCLEGLKPKQSK